VTLIAGSGWAAPAIVRVGRLTVPLSNTAVVAVKAATTRQVEEVIVGKRRTELAIRHVPPIRSGRAYRGPVTRQRVAGWWY
jgi:hypothetical protein